MDMLNNFRKLFAYNAWANREALKSLRNSSSPSPKALRFFCHIVAAERLWHMRLLGNSIQGFVVWPEWTVEQCAAEFAEVIERWDTYLAGMTPEMLGHSIGYTNTMGEAWHNMVSDVLTHVIIHSGYHRGQIAADIRASGGEPAYSDYIHAVRQGLLDQRNADAG
jgi:uncharacterized damage-inducible protein DinB